MDFTVFLSSSVVGGLVAAFVALRSGERKIQIENITQERAKWRDKIRIKSVELCQAAIEKDQTRISSIHLEFSLNLNPFDQEDKGILSVISALKDSEILEEKMTEFSDRVALLLKHDWERAKHEAKPWFFRWHPPKRISYKEFKDQQQH